MGEPEAAKSQEPRAASPEPKKFQKGQRAMSQFSGMAGVLSPPKESNRVGEMVKWRERRNNFEIGRKQQRGMLRQWNTS